MAMKSKILSAFMLAFLITACSSGSKTNPFTAGIPRCDDLVGKPVIAQEWEKGCLTRKAGESKDTIELSITYHCVNGTNDVVVAGDEYWGRVGEPAQKGKPIDHDVSACQFGTPATATTTTP